MYALQLHMTHFHFPNLKQNFTSAGMILSDATKYLKIAELGGSLT